MKRHWYTVRFEYVSGTQILFANAQKIGIATQSVILNDRKLKRIFVPNFINDMNVKHLLCNGRVLIKVEAYLGAFDADRRTFKDYLAEIFGNLILEYFMVNSDRR